MFFLNEINKNQDGVQRDTLLPDGNYNKKLWIDGEVIYKDDLNVIEDIAYKNRAKILDSDTITRLSIEDSTLALTTNKWQVVNMENNTTITLPEVNDFTEIHLFFRTNSELTLILPSAVWKNQPTIEANKVYEFVFTYVDEWIAGCIVYNE